MKAADQIQRSNDSPNSHTGKQFLFLEEGIHQVKEGSA